MTAIVGILCKNGVVLGSDSSATFSAAGGLKTIEQPTSKIEIIGGKLIFAGTGSVGINQRICAVINRLWDQNKLPSTLSAIDFAKRIAGEAIKDLAETACYPHSCTFAALIAYYAGNSPQLCEFEFKTLQPELKTAQMCFCSLGITQPMTDPFLAFMRKVYWNDRVPGLPDGIFAANWTLQHAIELNTGGVGGPANIAVLSPKKGQYSASMLEEADLQEYNQHISDSISKLREIRAIHNGTQTAGVPEIPQP